MNRSGFYKSCRDFICKVCQQQANWKDYKRDVCGDCEGKARRHKKAMGN